MTDIEKAIEYFEDAVKETDETIAECSPPLQKQLTEQREHFVVALAALQEKAERDKGCDRCRGWDKRCGANYCPMCGKELEEWQN